MKRPDAPDYLLGIAGAGAMGQGIAQVSAAGGMRSLLLDARPDAAAQAVATIKGRLARLVEKGRMTEAAAAAAGERLVAVQDIAELAGCDAVVEAVFEDLETKRDLFRELEAAVRPDCLLASNTSSIPIASIARACDKRERVAGLHFFNPVPLMKLVEVITGPETSQATAEALAALGERLGRVPVRVKDAPGFLVNMGGRAFTTEALRIAHENIATPAQIDAIMRDCRHFRMGPFELMDLTGIDVNYPVSQIVYDGYMQDPRIRTSPNHKALFDAGRLGRKSGVGWYRYDAGGRPVDPPSPDHESEAAPAQRVCLAEADDRLAGFCTEIGLETGPDDGACPILAAPLGADATTTALRSGADFRRLVALDLLGDTRKRVTLMTAPGADPRLRDAVAAAIARSGRKVTAIKDSPGFVGQRIAAMIANLGCYMAEVGLASPADIDTAMKLGLNYPLGPLELAEDIGLAETREILSQLQSVTGEDRYRPTAWLNRRAALGLPIHTAS
ncbi:MAG: 3-hydroxyacyl-CoA dehydrogenase [Kiloniellaceae bacterium]|nr:3-hydroxyacyl-CoA dehydrogenase [Kiloniellaceae bacterium]